MADTDMQLFRRLGIRPEQRTQKPDLMHEQAIREAVMEKQEESELFYDASKPRSSAQVSHSDV